jgi:hypothetical protein
MNNQPTTYSLLLTASERKATDWIGGSYSHGNQLFTVLNGYEVYQNNEWDSEEDIEFKIPENVAWQISEIIEEDNLACFSDELREKFCSFQQKIV